MDSYVVRIPEQGNYGMGAPPLEIFSWATYEGRTNASADGAFIAALDPATVLALCDAVDERDEWRRVFGHLSNVPDEAGNMIHAERNRLLATATEGDDTTCLAHAHPNRVAETLCALRFQRDAESTKNFRMAARANGADAERLAAELRGGA